MCQLLPALTGHKRRQSARANRPLSLALAMHPLYKGVLVLLLCLLPLHATLHSSAAETVLDILHDSTIKVFHAATRQFSSGGLVKMPLVVPGIQSTGGGDSEDWQSKLMGKKLGDSHDDIVSLVVVVLLCSYLSIHHSSCPSSPPTSVLYITPLHSLLITPHTSCEQYMLTQTQTFAKSDLPKEHRVIQPGGMSTMDFKPERVNVHVSDDGTVHKVTKG
jgi:hypothetical protein